MTTVAQDLYEIAEERARKAIISIWPNEPQYKKRREEAYNRIFCREMVKLSPPPKSPVKCSKCGQWSEGARH